MVSDEQLPLLGLPNHKRLVFAPVMREKEKTIQVDQDLETGPNRLFEFG